MANMRMKSLGGFSTMSDEMNFFFDNMFRLRRPLMMPFKGAWHPSIDVIETDKEYVVLVDIAGMRQEDIRLSFDSDQLTIQGIRREIDYGDERHYHMMEIDFGPFERRITLPKDVDRDKINAMYKDGFLEVRLEKRPEEAGGTVTIEVE